MDESLRDLAKGLQTKKIGQHIIYFDTISSTNDEAKRIAKNLHDGAVVIAEAQEGGRGRLSRKFFTPRGGLWFSIVLHPVFSPENAPKCTLMAAVAVLRALKKIDVEVGIKWPNDILAGGKKICGILTEMSTTAAGIDYIVVGIGINGNIPREKFPPGLREIATSISIVKGQNIDRKEFMQTLFQEFEDLYDNASLRGFSSILEEWRKYSVTLGESVEVIGSEERFWGKAMDIDDEGALLVLTQEGERRVLAGDVSVRSGGKIGASCACAGTRPSLAVENMGE